VTGVQTCALPISFNWYAPTSFSNDASATSVGSADSSGKVNAAAGFSIISYVGTSGPDTIAHGLSATLEMIIVKNRSADGQEWLVYPWEREDSAPIQDYLQSDEFLEFAEREDNSVVWPEEDCKLHTIGGLSNDKEGSFMKFVNKQKDE